MIWRKCKSVQKVCNLEFVTRNYTYEKDSMTDILQKPKWESLQKRRKDNRITCILLYKGLKGRAKIPTDDLIPKTSYIP